MSLWTAEKGFDTEDKNALEQFIFDIFGGRKRQQAEEAAREDREMNRQIAQENLQYQKDVFEWQKQQQELQYAREDSSIQRRMADLEKAGLNKMLAVTGPGAAAGKLASVSAPQNPMTYDIEKNPKIVKENVNRMRMMNAMGLSSMLMDLMMKKRQVKRMDMQDRLLEEMIEAKQWDVEHAKTTAQPTGKTNWFIGATTFGARILEWILGK